jgi:hypothetical protein
MINHNVGTAGANNLRVAQVRILRNRDQLWCDDMTFLARLAGEAIDRLYRADGYGVFLDGHER